MMKEELQKKFEELRDAVVEMDKDQSVIGVGYDTRTKLMEVHVYGSENFPAHNKCHEEYVWRDSKHFPWEKRVLINGVIYYDCITQEQFDREHAKEENNDDNQQDGQECNA